MTCRRHNRIAVLLTALLHLFFTTFGAVTHNHAPSDPVRHAGRADAAVTLRSADPGTPSTGGDCSMCDWQAVSVVAPPLPFLLTAGLTGSVPCVPRYFPLVTRTVPRASLRGPPLS